MSVEKYFDYVMNMTQRRFQIAKELIVDKSCDIFMPVFVGPDRLQHKMWGKKERIDDYHTALDIIIGRL